MRKPDESSSPSSSPNLSSHGGDPAGPMTPTTTSPGSPLPCPTCSKPPHVNRSYMVHVYCRDCYDPTPMNSLSNDGPRAGRLMGTANSWGNDAAEAEAVEDWNDAVRMFVEDQYERSGRGKRRWRR